MNVDKLIKRKQHAKRDGNLPQLAEITKTLGDIYFENEEPKKALSEYTEQLSVCEALQDKLNCAIAHRMIGEVYTNLEDYEQALMHQNLYLEGAEEIKNLIEKQRALATLGRTYLCLAESLINYSTCKRSEALANAETAFVQSMELCDQLGTEIKVEEKTLMRARLLLNLGLTLEAQKQTQQAINLMEKAIVLCKSNNFQEDLHRTCISLASIYEQRNNHELALNYIEIAATVSDTRLKAEAKVAKAELFMRSGQWIEARKVLTSLYQSSRLSKDINHQVERYLRIVVTLCRVENDVAIETSTQAKQKLYEKLGDAAVAVQSFDQGVEYYRHMLTCAEETGNQIGISLISLARTLKDAKRYNEALPFAQREFELCTNPRERCRSALFLVDLFRTTDATDAKIREYYTLALNSADESDNVKLQKSVMKEFVGYLESIGQFDEANNAKQKAGLTSEILSSEESELSSEESEIGADICLEDLSDMEVEESVKETNIVRKRTRRAFAIKRNEKGETQLHVACINGDISAVERLLSSGHPTNVRDHYGWTPLHEAANHGYVDIVELLLKHGTNVNDPGSISCKGMTPLHDAACCGHFSVMQLLMQYGANITLKTHDGETVLDCLEDWRDRVEDLRPQDLVDYDIMHKKLSAVILVRKKRRSDNARTVDKKSAQSEPQKMSAGEDYKRTIANLRSFNKTNNTAAVFKSSNDTVEPLVSEEQILIDDWLEDDIGSTVKKKFTSNNRIVATKRKSFDENLQSTSKRLKVNDTFGNEEYFGVSEDSSDDDATELTQPFERSRRIKRKRQTSLTSSGFVVSHTPSPVHLESSTTSSKQHDKEYVCLPIFVKEKKFDLKIEICEDEKEFLRSITAITERLFFNETGCTIKLQLQPINGDIATREDILKIARESADGRRMECEIVELQIPPITDRYKTICCTYHSVPCEAILKCLKTCENTGIFRVKSDDVDKGQLVPLLKTLEYERNLKLLKLSGILLLTAGAHLHQCFSNLSLLQELYLKGCDIDSTCLREINLLPSQLKVLDLSYNPLGSESRDVLCKLIAPLRHLQTLNLCYCKLANFHFPLDNPNVTNCNISWNKLSRDAIASFLSRTMFDLNLSNVPPSNRFMLNTMSVTLSPSIESLELSFCDITDSDVKIILAQLPRLLKLILTGNVNISVLSVNRLLSRQPTLTYIDVSGCKSIVSDPEAQLIIQNPEICTLLASIQPNLCDSWIKLWRGAGSVTKLPHNLAIFKPI